MKHTEKWPYRLWAYRKKRDAVIAEAMTLHEFEEIIRDIKVENGWNIILDLSSIWSLEVHDKESGRLLAHTGCTSLEAVLYVLSTPLDEWM